jgi:hypothetical protein
MHETPEDLLALEELLDRSRASAGAHLRSIFSDEWAINALGVAGRLLGVQILHLGTVTAAGEPRVSPVDGLFFRGAFHFGTSPDAMRAVHLRARPAVSGSVTHGEEFAVIVHGRAVEFEFDTPEQEALRGYYREVYGEGWEGFRRGNPYWRIEAERLFAFARG